MQLQELNNSILIIIDHNMDLYHVHGPTGETEKREMVSECQIKPSSDCE